MGLLVEHTVLTLTHTYNIHTSGRKLRLRRSTVVLLYIVTQGTYNELRAPGSGSWLLLYIVTHTVRVSLPRKHGKKIGCRNISVGNSSYDNANITKIKKMRMNLPYKGTARSQNETKHVFYFWLLESHRNGKPRKQFQSQDRRMMGGQRHRRVFVVCVSVGVVLGRRARRMLCGVARLACGRVGHLAQSGAAYLFPDSPVAPAELVHLLHGRGEIGEEQCVVDGVPLDLNVRLVVERAVALISRLRVEPPRPPRSRGGGACGGSTKLYRSILPGFAGRRVNDEGHVRVEHQRIGRCRAGRRVVPLSLLRLNFAFRPRHVDDSLVEGVAEFHPSSWAQRDPRDRAESRVTVVIRARAPEAVRPHEHHDLPRREPRSFLENVQDVVPRVSRRLRAREKAGVDARSRAGVAVEAAVAEGDGEAA
jgi:hypothetical protein